MFHFRPRVSPSLIAKHAQPAETSHSAWEPVPAVTDWDWFMDFVHKGGQDSQRRYESWIKRRDRLTGGFQERISEFKRFRHEKIYCLKPSDFDLAKRHMGGEHALGNLSKNEIDHSLSADFSPPIPFMYPFHDLLEKLGRLPKWSEAWRHLLDERPELVLEPYAAYNRLETDDPVFRTSRYLNAFQWRLGIVFYSWLRELHLLTELRCVHRLDVRYHFAVDAEWKADLVGGNVLLELFVINESYKNARGQGRKETCATANPWARTVRVGFVNRRLRGRPYLMEDSEIQKIAAEMAAAGCPKLQ